MAGVESNHMYDLNNVRWITKSHAEVYLKGLWSDDTTTSLNDNANGSG